MNFEPASENLMNLVHNDQYLKHDYILYNKEPINKLNLSNSS